LLQPATGDRQFIGEIEREPCLSAQLVSSHGGSCWHLTALSWNSPQQWRFNFGVHPV